MDKYPIKNKLLLVFGIAIIVIPVLYKTVDEIFKDMRQAELVSKLIAQAERAFYKGDFAMSASAYLRARNIDPLSRKAHKGLARARTYLAAWSPDLIRPADADDIIIDATQTIEEFPNDKAIAESAIGHVYGITGRSKEAYVHYSTALSIDPQCGPAHLGQALLFRTDESKIEDAIREFKEVLKIRPGHIESSTMLARLLIKKEEYPDAITLLKGVLEQKEDPNVRLDLAQALVSDGKPDLAIEHFKKVVNLDPRSAEGWAGLGNALGLTKNFQEAEKALRMAVSLQASSVNIQRLGSILNRLGRFREAFALLQQLAEKGGEDNPYLAFELGYAAENIGNKEKAIFMYEIVVNSQSSESPNTKESLDVIKNHALERLRFLRNTEQTSSSLPQNYEETKPNPKKTSPLPPQ